MREAVRYLSRSPRFALSCSCIVALGVTLSTLLFAVVEATLIDPWPYDGADRIVTITASYPEQGRERYSLWSAPEVEDLSRQTDVFDAVIAGVAEPMTFDAGGGAERVRGAAITPAAFAMLGVRAARGRALQAGDVAPGAPAVAVVSDAFWRERLGGAADAVGRTLRLRDQSVTIVGVMPPPFRWWDREIWTPLRIDPLASRTARYLYVQGRLRSGLSVAEAQHRLAVVSARLFADHPERLEYRTIGISLRPLLDDVLRELRPALTVLLIAVLLVMVVAAANLANLVLGRAQARAGEFAVRYAIGAPRGRVLGQLLGETLLISTAGSVLGITAAAFLIGPATSLIPYGFVPAEATVRIDWRVAAVASVIALALGAAAALVPAARTAAMPLTLVLRREDARTGARRIPRVRYAFVVCQVALAMVLTAASAAAALAVARVVTRDPGYTASGAWTARVTEGRPEAVSRVLDALRQRSNAPTAAVTVLPVGDLPTALVSSPRRTTPDGANPFEVDYLGATPGLEGALGVRLREGRSIAEADGAGHAPVALVTAGLAHRLWTETAPGQVLTIQSGSTSVNATVIGVLADIDSRGDRRPRPLVVVPLAQLPAAPGAVTYVGRGPIREGVAGLRSAVRSLMPGAALYEEKTLTAARREMLGARIFAGTLLAAFCMAVLVLSAVGLHSLIGELARERRRDTAIRLALGARPGALFLGDVSRTLFLVACGGAAALPGLLSFPGRLSGVFSGIRSLAAEASLFGVTAVALVCVAAAALPAYRSTRAGATAQRALL